MAQRRMFSRRLTDSARFVKMPPTTQMLYIHLGLHADDDGIVEAYTVMNTISATEDDLRILVAKNFVVVLNEDLVTYIMDWQENNKIRADRKVDSIYKDLLLQVVPNVQLVEPKRRADTKKKPMDIQWTTNGQPVDGIGKDRIGEDSIGKDSIGEKTTPKKKPKTKYAEFVSMTEEEYQKLIDTHGKVMTKECIEILDNYKGSSGKRYKSDYRAILSWVVDKVKEKRPKKELTAVPESMEEQTARMFEDWGGVK